MSEKSGSENREQLLSAYFEPVVVDSPRITKYPDGSWTSWKVNRFLGYRLRQGVTLDWRVIEIMRQNGINPKTLYCEDSSGGVTRMRLREGSSVTRRKNDGVDQDRGTFSPNILSLHLGQRGEFAEARPKGQIVSEPSQQLMERYLIPDVNEVVLRTNVLLTDAKINSSLPTSTLAMRYHSTPQTK